MNILVAVYSPETVTELAALPGIGGVRHMDTQHPPGVTCRLFISPVSDADKHNRPPSIIVSVRFDRPAVCSTSLQSTIDGPRLRFDWSRINCRSGPIFNHPNGPLHLHVRRHYGRFEFTGRFLKFRIIRCCKYLSFDVCEVCAALFINYSHVNVVSCSGSEKSNGNFYFRVIFGDTDVARQRGGLMNWTHGDVALIIKIRAIMGDACFMSIYSLVYFTYLQICRCFFISYTHSNVV